MPPFLYTQKFNIIIYIEDQFSNINLHTAGCTKRRYIDIEQTLVKQTEGTSK